MEGIKLLSAFLLVIKYCLEEALLVSSQEIQRCSYQIPTGDKKTELQFTNELWTIQTSEYTIYYTLCGFVPYNLGHYEAAACLMSKKPKTEYELCTKLGSNFVIGSDNRDPILRSFNGTKCPHGPNHNYSVIIHFKCSDQITEQPLLVQNNDKCLFEITMMHPSCLPKCTYRVLDNFVDLRPLKGSHLVQTDDGKNYTISLCGPASECGENEDYSVCEMKNGEIVPLATYKSLDVGYKNKKESVFVHGDIADKVTGKKFVTFKLFFKCNWETFSKGLHLIKKMTQSVHYDFEIESSIGCVVKHVPCSISSNFLVYDLSKLYADHPEKWTVKNYINKRNLWLNICGPLNLINPISSKCTDTHARVCENANGVFTNKGSVFSDMKLDGDVIEATVEDGMRCSKHPSRNYRTVINFHCNEDENGPYLDRSEDCDTFIKWRTPAACPEFLQSACEKPHTEYKKCKMVYHDKLYDLSPLTLHGNKSHVIKNGTKEFMINVCGPVFDADAPCMTYANVAMKDLRQFNKKYRVTSLGKYNKMDFFNDNIIIEYRGGTWCSEDLQDYTSRITFSCSETEEEPVLSHQTACTYSFLWKTKYACPDMNSKLIKKCPLLEDSSDKRVDITNLRTSVKVENDNKQITFDICGDNFTMCTENGNCNYMPYTSKTVDLPYLKLTLPINCRSPQDFNKTEILLECDSLINNSHFDNFTKSDCTLRFNYVSDAVCVFTKNNKNKESGVSETTTIKQKKEIQTNKTSQQSKFEPINLVTDCAVSNNVTSFQFSLSLLQLNFTKNCPYVTSLNNSSLVVQLRYQTEKRCTNKTSNNETTYYYEIILHCTDGQATELKENHPDQCFGTYHYNRLEFCNFFNNPLTSESINTQTAGMSVTGIISFVVTIIMLALIVGGVAIYKKWGFRCCRRNPDYCNVYFKNGDL